MKHIFILLLAVLTEGCMSMYTGYTRGSSNLFDKWVYYQYSYEMEGVHPDSAMVFNDSLINARFNIGREGIGMKLENKSAGPLKVIWNETSYISDNKAGKVAHVGVKYNERNSSMPPTLIPPGTSIEDEITPVDKIRWMDGSTYVPGRWVTDPLFADTDVGDSTATRIIMANKGRQFSVYMPIQHGNDATNYHWKFKIADVKPKPK